MKVLIATATRPKGYSIFNLIRDMCTENELKVKGGFKWTTGPGCTNLAFEIEGDDETAEKLANALTMALMPAKWTTTTDLLPDVDEIDDEILVDVRERFRRRRRG